MSTTPITDKFAALRRLTPSRVRFDDSLRAPALDRVIDFQASHARSRDAIHRATDWARIQAALAPQDCVLLSSKAEGRKTYLARPDLGRQLSEASSAVLEGTNAETLVIVLGDGLSSVAVERHGASMVAALRNTLPDMIHSTVYLVDQARVAIADDIGAALGAKATVMLIGERPGLSVSDSLGAYFTYGPARGLSDSRRNCVSNIHPNGGLTVDAAAARVAWLWHEARKLGASGVTLKDMSDARPVLTTDPERNAK